MDEIRRPREKRKPDPEAIRFVGIQKGIIRNQGFLGGAKWIFSRGLNQMEDCTVAFD